MEIVDGVLMLHPDQLLIVWAVCMLINAFFIGLYREEEGDDGFSWLALIGVLLGPITLILAIIAGVAILIIGFLYILFKGALFGSD